MTSWDAKELLSTLKINIPEIQTRLGYKRVSIWGNRPTTITSLVKKLDNYFDEWSRDLLSSRIIITNSSFNTFRSNKDYLRLKSFNVDIKLDKARIDISRAIKNELNLAKRKAINNKQRIKKLNLYQTHILKLLNNWLIGMSFCQDGGDYVFVDDVITFLSSFQNQKILRKPLVDGLQSFSFGNREKTYSVIQGLKNSKDRFFVSPTHEGLQQLIILRRKFGNVPIQK